MANVVVVGPDAKSIASAWASSIGKDITISCTEDRGVAYYLTTKDTAFILACEQEAPHLLQTFLLGPNTLPSGTTPAQVLPVFRYVTNKDALDAKPESSESKGPVKVPIPINSSKPSTKSSKKSSSSSLGQGTSIPISTDSEGDVKDYKCGKEFTFVLSEILSGAVSFAALEEKAKSWRSDPPKLRQSKLSKFREREIEQSVCSGLSFNVLELNGLELEFSAVTILRPYLDVLSMTDSQLGAFVASVHSLYRSSPYHCWSHAVDVLQFLSITLHLNAVHMLYSRVEIATALVTALVHDIDHDGITNRGHTALKSERSVFSAESTQEKHHLKIAKCLFEYSHLYERLHHDILDQLIDATDMAVHGAHVKKFEQLLDQGARFIESEYERMQLLIVLMKSADLGNTVRSSQTARVWGDMLADEFHLAFEREERAKVPKEKSSFPHGNPIEGHDMTQLGFYQHVVTPFYALLAKCHVLDSLYVPLLRNAELGLKHFQHLTHEKNSESPDDDLQP